jgi:hypothetical protein
MKIALIALCAWLATSPAAAQAHARHTAAHDSAHAIKLTDAEHLALHHFLLGAWTGTLPRHGAAHQDTLNLRFENDSLGQQLMIRDRNAVGGFVIRGDSLQWNQAVGRESCLASTSVAALIATSKAGARAPAKIDGTIACGTDRSQFTLRKVGSLQQ